ncbi:MAG: hypothetical protein AAGU11_06640 [Syntrophobacteraceae bacterium]
MRSLFVLAVLTAILLGPVSCGVGDHDLSGKYKVTGARDEMQMQISLKSDGKGTWKVRGEESSFVWEQRGEEIHLHSKTGGVITGRLDKDHSIHIFIPGMESFHFVRTEK